MNKVSCKCLNVIISSELGFCDARIDNLNLTIEEKRDSFLGRNDLRQVEKLDKISKSLPDLVEAREVGSWIINYCIICKVHTHAEHKKKRASPILIHPSLLPEEDINRLRLDKNFSKAYKILINVGRFPNNQDGVVYPNEMESLMMRIKQNATETLKKEAAKIEERIKKYTDDQYYLLDALTERLTSEEQTLMRTALEHYKKSDGNQENKFKFLRNTNEPRSVFQYIERSSQGLALSPKKQKSSSVSPSELDELMFPFDCADDKPFSDHEDLEATAIEDDTTYSERYQPRARSSSIKFAKSLPMDIPTFLKPKNNNHTIDFSDEDDDDSLHEERNIDIAASIKKLAKSVHGSEIFGDLPRPRFSTLL